MDWVLEHLNVLLVVAGSIAYWINQRRREKMGEPADYDEDGIPENRPLTPLAKPDETEEAERTRRIQEEIRRKIMERRGGPVPPPVPSQPSRPAFPREAPPVERSAPPPLPPPVPPSLKPVVERVDVYTTEPAEDVVLRRQRELMEKLRELETTRRQEPHPLHAGAQAFSSPQVGAGTTREAIAELRDPRTLRKVIIQREVLGPPVSLR